MEEGGKTTCNNPIRGERVQETGNEEREEGEKTVNEEKKRRRVQWNGRGRQTIPTETLKEYLYEEIESID